MRAIGGAGLSLAFVAGVMAFSTLPRAAASPEPTQNAPDRTTTLTNVLALLPPDFGSAVATAAVPPVATAAQPIARPRLQPRKDPVPVVMPITGATPRGGFGSRGPMWAVAHSGLDFSTGIGTPAVAVVSGTIRAVFMHPAFGWVEELRRADGVSFWYCHLSQPIAEPGQVVRQGQVIGLTGDTGNTSGPHLHFEVRVDGVPTDPADFLFNQPGTASAAPGWASAYREEPPPGRTIVGWPPSKEELAKQRAEREKAAREKAARQKAEQEKKHRDDPSAGPTSTPTPTGGGDSDESDTATPNPTQSSAAPAEPAPQQTASTNSTSP